MTIETRAAMRRITGYSAARPSGVCCFESLSVPSARASRRTDAVEIEQDRRGDQRAGQAAAAGLVGAGHEAHAQGPVEPEQPAAGTAHLAPSRAGAR